MSSKIRTYTELEKLDTFISRFNYLKLDGYVGESTFGFDRYLNQVLYKSSRWLRLRRHIVLRDEGCDLGIIGHEIFDKIIIHHLNPITPDDIKSGSDLVFNPEYLISTSHKTHLAIHFSNEELLQKPLISRFLGDTIPWR